MVMVALWVVEGWKTDDNRQGVGGKAWPGQGLHHDGGGGGDDDGGGDGDDGGGDGGDGGGRDNEEHCRPWWSW